MIAGLTLHAPNVDIMPYFPSGTGMSDRDEESPRAANQDEDAGAARASTPLDPIRVKNRRKRYLDVHPEYFGANLELAGVLLMD